VSESSVPHALHRVHPDGSEEPVGEFASFEEGWQAGTHLVTCEDYYGAYSLYAGGRLVAHFAHARLLAAGFDTERTPYAMFGVVE
jgi:hypothetical protein